MIITKTVEIDVDVEVDEDDFDLSNYSIDCLLDEIASRDQESGWVDWARMYEIAASGSADELTAEIRKVIEAKTGRILP